jgi:hypothetical protein
MDKEPTDCELVGSASALPRKFLFRSGATKETQVLTWVQRRQQAEKLAQSDAETLIRDFGAGAYWEAREREHDVILPDGTIHTGRTTAHWRRVALIVANWTGHEVGLATAVRTLKPAFIGTELDRMA